MPRALAQLCLTTVFVECGVSLRDRFEADNPNYINLIGSYFTSAAQMNLAVGREVIQ